MTSVPLHPHQLEILTPLCLHLALALSLSHSLVVADQLQISALLLFALPFFAAADGPSTPTQELFAQQVAPLATCSAKAVSTSRRGAETMSMAPRKSGTGVDKKARKKYAEKDRVGSRERGRVG